MSSRSTQFLPSSHPRFTVTILSAVIMRLEIALQLQVLFLTLTFAAPAPVPKNLGASPTSGAPSAQSTVCGDIVNSCNTTFTAKQAYDCLTSVPFNAAVATRFIKYYNDTIQFQSTLAYLKNPPTTYQQPAIDILAGLEQIQENVAKGLFPNQYAFEATLQNLVYSAHDAHFQLESGILTAFTFQSPYSIVSLSEDGVQVPKVYLTGNALSASVLSR